MNYQYNEFHVDGLLDRFNEVLRENEDLRKLLFNALRVISAPAHFEIATDQEKAWGLEIQEALQSNNYSSL